MRIKKNEAPTKKYYIYGGVATGALLSLFYIYWNLTHRTGSGLSATPDPIWTIFVNVALIFFVAVYQSILIFRAVGWFRNRKNQGN